MSRYSVDAEQVLALVAKARAIGQRLEEHAKNVDREIDALHIEWEGSAAEAHRANHDKRKKEFQDMRTALSGLETDTKAAHDRYVANVDLLKKMWPS